MKIKLFVLVLLSILPIAAEAQYGRPYFRPIRPRYYGPQPYGPYYYPGPAIGPYFAPGPFYAGPRYPYARPIYPYYGAREAASGIKFSLDHVAKNDRAAIESGQVYLPDNNGKMGYRGIVSNFSGRQAIPLSPGNHDVAVYLLDHRTLHLSVLVQSGHVTTVSLSQEAFSEPVPEPTHK